MNIEVNYGDKKFGTGSDPKKYKLTVSGGSPAEEVTIEFKFDYYTDRSGKGNTSDGLVVGGEICLPKREAAAMATAILWCCLQSGYESSPSTVELVLDEREPKNTNEIQFTTARDVFEARKKAMENDRRQRFQRIANEIVDQSAGIYTSCEVMPQAQGSADWQFHFQKSTGGEVKVTLVRRDGQTDQVIKKEIESELAQVEKDT